MPSDALCAVTKEVGGDTYICGGGSDGYQDDQIFEDLGIQLEYQNFKHPEYSQLRSESFTSGLSIIDVVMNLVWEKVSNILNITI